MENRIIFKAYFKDIEEKIIESIERAELSIKIAMAWFTSRPIKLALLNHKLRNPSISVEILVDNNRTNDEYFYNTKVDFEKAGIVIYPERAEMLHHKFMVVDGKLTIMGSYNFSKNAKTNLESICLAKSVEFSSVYARVFSSLTNTDYIDENIYLLAKHPTFSQKLLSTYYPFTNDEFIKFRELLVSGHCFTYDYGFGDRLDYEPGFLFNRNLNFTNFRKQEFHLPFNKNFIQSWEVNNDMLNILDSYAGHEEHYHLINDDLERSEKQVKEYFQRIIESTYNSIELEKLINEDVNIIIEDRLWSDNFELFIRPEHLEMIFDCVRKKEMH
jgi:hypothetical protein